MSYSGTPLYSPGIFQIMRHYFTGIILLALFLVSACATSDKPERLPPTSPRTLVCDNGQYAYFNIYGPDKAALKYSKTTYSLKRTRTASGVKYEKGDVFVWNRGLSYLIHIEPNNHTCLPQPDLIDGLGL
tara:strand:+ start:59 stop:448 length:390 start_codon:yes stop_codon:yes gene_type:complete